LLTLRAPRKLNRSRPKVLRMLANTGSTMPSRRLNRPGFSGDLSD
jgi:hypothetical protein